MSKSAIRYFEAAGHQDAVRGHVIAHLATLEPRMQEAYIRGQSFTAPKVRTYKLNRTVGELKSGTIVSTLCKFPENTKGNVAVKLENGETVTVPFSRLTKVN